MSNTCQSDTLLMDFLNGIRWSSYFGLIKGECEDNPLFHYLVSDSNKADGEFSYTTPKYMGDQLVTLSWSKQPESNSVVLYVYQVSPPSLD